ncbi:hypothetical protein G7046_g5453 [Stylonectria norvegica]|nr:hypothetical protein G7046_g5453 [Stylonectria norvegica]
MLTSRTSIDGGPLHPSPVQELAELQIDDCRPRFDTDTTVSVPRAAQIPVPSFPQLQDPAPLHVPPRDRDSYFNVDAGSPKIHSPLWQSTSYETPYETPLEYPLPNSTQRAGAFQNHWNRRSNLADMSYTGDEGKGISSDEASRNRLTPWFARGTTPAAKLPNPTPQTTKPPLIRSNSAKFTPKVAPPSTGSSRFAFFASSVSALKDMANPPVVVPQDDELMCLDIDEALTPTGAPADGLAFSPAAFKNMQMTAVGLLKKFQIAYQQRTIEFRELKADQEARLEEEDEVNVRVHHLKMQLEDMAQKAAEREAAMHSLLQELAIEKKLRMEDRMGRDATVPHSEASAVSEDLNAEEDQRHRDWRASGATAKSDQSADTDEESLDEASIFSRSRSPTITTSMSEMSPVEPPAPSQKPVKLAPPRLTRSSSQMSAFQKIFKGIAGETPGEDGTSTSTNGCRSCRRQEARMAWDTVNLLKNENKGLKSRVQELETAVEGVLDVVNGFTI